jgi:predicted nucleic acid-binding protein
LIDTNVISEIRKGDKDDPGVRWFFDAAIQNNQRLYISVITVGELRRAVDLIFHRGDISQGTLLEAWLNSITEQYQDNILGIDSAIALICGKMRVPNPQYPIDKLIAATALIYDLTVVTRNTEDFQNTGIAFMNPFSGQEKESWARLA